MDIQSLKDNVQREVDAIADQLIACSDWMADNPELGLEEFKAAERLTAMLEDAGAAVTRGIADLPTAFQAELPGSSDGPTIAIIAEYDALPDVGHGCGHNIIANTAIGAALALIRLEALAQLPGRVLVIGTPAEENAGGKIDILEHGYFDNVDAAIMIHPGFEDQLAAQHMTALSVEFEFYGKTAHAALDPYLGLNALDAMIQTFVNVGLLRQQVRAEARIHGVITHGGEAPNVIPAYTASRFEVRSFDVDYAQDLRRRVIACAEGAATATGTRLEWHEFAKPYLSYEPNTVLGKVAQANMAALGRTVIPSEPVQASSDFGNVSQVAPAMCMMLAMCDPGINWHSKEVADATISPRGHAVLLRGAKLLAMSALDLLGSPDLIAQARQEHQAAVNPA
jgi:amidohydrolase